MYGVINISNAANQALLDADDGDDTEEVFSSDRSAVDPKRSMENVDHIENFSLEDITEGSDVVRERTLTKEDEERLLEEERAKAQKNLDSATVISLADRTG